MPNWNGHEFNTFAELTALYTNSRLEPLVVNRMTDYVYRIYYDQLRATIPQYTMGGCGNCGQRYRVYREDMIAMSTACTRCQTCPSCVTALAHQHCNRCQTARNIRRGEFMCRGCWLCGTCVGGPCPVCTEQTVDDSHCQRCCGTIRTTATVIRNYNDRHYPAARPTLADPKKPFLYLGVELEVEVEAAAQFYRDGLLQGAGQTIIQRVAKTVILQHPNDVILKGDSSIHHGFEVVTGPFSLDEHKKLWPSLTKNLRQDGCRSWSYPNTGIHIHLSRNWFSSLDLGKALTFLNSDKNRPYIIKIAGRDQRQHATTFDKKKATDIFRPVGRYEALNLTNPKTVEMRIFNGTINLEHILADLEFAHALSNWVKEASMRDVESWSTFYGWVLGHRKDYQHLINFFTRNNHEDREDV